MVSKLNTFADQLMDNDRAIKAVTQKAMEKIDSEVKIIQNVAGDKFKTIEEVDLPRLWGSIQSNDVWSQLLERHAPQSVPTTE